MGVDHRLVPVPMRMRLCDRPIMLVLVLVMLIMGMAVFMFERVVLVFIPAIASVMITSRFEIPTFLRFSLSLRVGIRPCVSPEWR